MTYFLENMEFINKRSRMVEASISNEEPLFPFELEPTADGLFNYVLENETSRCFIHSIYSVPREMKHLFKEVDPDVEVLILFGFGCGYAIDYIGEMFHKVKHVIVIEPILQLFREVLKKVQLKSMVERANTLTLILNRDIEDSVAKVGEAIANDHWKRIDLVYHLSYRSLLKGYYESFHSLLIKHLQTKREGIAYREMLKKKWPVSLFENLKMESLPVELLFQELPKMGVALLTGGPSLKKSPHIIEELKKRALVIALGDANYLLEEMGIAPHLRFFPYQGKSSASFSFKEDRSAPLIYSDHLPSQLLSSYQGYKWKLILRSDALSQYIYNQGGIPYYLVREGPSIVNTLVDLLGQAQVKEIFFFDLSLSTKEKDVAGDGFSAGGFFLRFKRSIEEQIQSYSQVEFSIDEKEEIELEQCTKKSYEDFLHGLHSHDPHALLEDVAEKTPLLLSSYREGLERGLSKVEEELLTIQALTEKWIKDLNKMRRYKERNVGVHRLLKEFRYLDFHWEGLTKNPFYKQVIMRMLGDTLKTIFSVTEYQGEERRKEMESLEKRQRGLAAETEGYVEFLQSLMKEHREGEENITY